MGYCTVNDLRDEGVTVTMLSDTRAASLIELASRYIEKITRRWFEARDRLFRFRGVDSPILLFDVPIIQVDTVKLVSGRGSSMTSYDLDTDYMIVFNRHLTEGLLSPDDRDNPRIEFQSTFSLQYPGLDALFPFGEQVVEIQGAFGYTDLEDGVTPGETNPGSQIPLSQGETPKEIVHLCKLLVVRQIGEMGDPSRRDGWLKSWQVESEKTADQAYKMTPLDRLGRAGQFTGDPEIDDILTRYSATAGMGAV